MGCGDDDRAAVGERLASLTHPKMVGSHVILFSIKWMFKPRPSSFIRFMNTQLIRDGYSKANL